MTNRHENQDDYTHDDDAHDGHAHGGDGYEGDAHDAHRGEAVDDMDDRIVDAGLRATGTGLRNTTTDLVGTDVIIGSMRHQLVRSRRTSWVMGALAAAVAVALGASLTVIARRDDGAAKGRRSGGVTSPAVGDDAIALVEALPAQPVDPHAVQLVASVSRYDTCDDLMGQLHQIGAAHIGSMGFGSGGFMVTAAGYRASASDEKAADAATSDSRGLAITDDGAADGAGSGETLGTNVIVDGVDEPDSVKAVDDLVVDLAGPDLRIIDTKAGRIVSTLDMRPPEAVREDPDEYDPDAITSYPTQLLVDGTDVIVFGHESVPVAPMEGDPSATRLSRSYMTITYVDITDRAAPRTTDRVRIEGSLVTARRVGSKVRIVTRSSLADLPIVYPAGPASVATALRSNRLAVAESTAQDWIPAWDHGDGTGAAPLVDCGDVVVPDTFAGVEMTSLVEFDVNGAFDPRAMSILAPSQDLTADQNDVVVVSNVWVDPAKRSDDFKDWKSALHRFTFGNEGPRYVASGAVPGSVVDQFSVSILDATDIGVVTADVLPWQDRSKAKVFVRVLDSDPSAHTMSQIGVVEPPRAGQALTAVRFVGDRVLLSSGAMGNVLSAVDLGERDAPLVIGDVDLGASGGYIHPLGEDRIAVVGTTIKKVGNRMYSGIQVVTVDLTSMGIVARWVRDSASTQVGYDHHAFTWWPQRSIAAFGFDNQSNDSTNIPPEAVFLTIGERAIDARFVRPRDVDLGPACKPNQSWIDGCDWSGPPSVRRVLVVAGTPWLYTTESLEALHPDTLTPDTLINIWDGMH